MTSSPADRPTALITGVTGFAGRHLAARLLESGMSVTGTSRSGGEVTGVDVRALDIADRAALTALVDELRPGAVFHLAAIVDTVTTPSVAELERVNVEGTRAVSEAVLAAAPQARLVFTSSAFVYGRTGPEEQPIGEDQPLRPLTPYGETKVAAEGVIAEHVAAGGDAVIARAFQHTGPGHVGAYALSDWAEQLARIAAAGGVGRIATGNLDVERDYLDVRDVASAYAALAERGRPGAIYNVASGEGVTMRALLEGLIAAYGIDVEIVTDAARLRSVDQPSVVADVSRLKADTGWRREIEPATTLDDLAAFWSERIA